MLRIINRLVVILFLAAGCLSLNAQTRPPEPIVQPAPELPFSAKQRGISGKVVVSFIVTTEGKVVDIKILESPDPELSKSVIKTVQQWRNKAGILNGRRVNTRVKQPFSFTLEEIRPESPSAKTKEENAGEPGATDNPDDAQRLREDH